MSKGKVVDRTAGAFPGTLTAQLILLFAALFLTLAAPDADAQQRSIVNPSFEANDPAGPGTPTWQAFTNGQVPGWDSTTGYIELWDSGFQGVTAAQGNVLAEMNAYTQGALFQNVCFVNGEILKWSFAHQARSGGLNVQTANYEIASQSGALIQTVATHQATVGAGWGINSSPPGGIVYTGPSGVQRLQFDTPDPGSVGNLLDNINIYLTPYLEFSSGNGSNIEDSGGAGTPPAIVVDGTVTAATTVAITITGGTATLGTDYTTPSGTATFNVSIPAGTYASQVFPLGIQIRADSVVEGNETILMSIGQNPGQYAIASTTTCGGQGISNATYTIVDDDLNLVTQKTLSSGGTSTVAPGGTVNFNVLVSNAGPIAATNVKLTDTLPAGMTFLSATPTSGSFSYPTWTIPGIASGSSATLTLAARVGTTVANGTVLTNTVTAAKGDQTDTTASGDDLSETVVVGQPGMTMVKSTTATSFGAAGTTVPYTFTYRNTGTVALSNLTITDPMIPSLNCTVATLAAGAQGSCTVSYTVTQADVDAWAISGTRLRNTATAHATTSWGASVDVQSSVSLPGPTAAPAFTIAKVISPTTYATAGTILNYTITITNTGNVTFPAAPAVTDPLVTNAGGTISCPAGTVAPQTSVSCTASYTVTQAQVDSGSVVNTANASITVGGKTATGTANATATANGTASLVIHKALAPSSATAYSAVGTVLRYEYLLTNTGDRTLSAAQVADNKATVTCPAGGIAPGATLTCTASYTVTQADIDADQVTNIAQASALPAGSTTRINSVNTDTVSVPAVQNPSMSLAKSASNVTSAQFVPGFVVTYTYRVTNTGNLTLTQPISVTDSIIGTFPCGTVPLAPGAQTSCTRPYALTAADVARGLVHNSATATSGGTTSNEATATVSQGATPGLTLLKTSTTPYFTSLSDTINFTFRVTNSGQTTIVGLTPITINDATVASITCAQPATLPPGASFTCTGSYSPITQAEMDAGEVDNTATASFLYAGPGGSATISSPSSTARVPARVTNSVTLDKVGPVSFSAVGEVISYTFTVTNTGPQTIETATLSDQMMPAFNCVLRNIAPGASATCSTNYTVTQADMDAGRIDNTADVNATTDAGGSANATDTATVPVAAGAATKSMTLVKSSSQTNFSTVGEFIPFTFAVENTGTQTLTNVVVTDSLVPGYSCTISTLLPGVTDTTCTANYEVTQADINAGTITNGARATAPGAQTVTDTLTLTGPAAAPGLFLVKVASRSIFTATGQTITYSFDLINTGNVTLTSVQVTDNRLTLPPACANITLAPQATYSGCTGTYTVTQADVDAGSIPNTATATGVPVRGGPSVSATDSVTVDGPPANPQMTVTKTETDGSGGFGAVGSTETYSFTVRNLGNVTLTNIQIDDPLTGLSCAIADLAPGATATTCANGAALRGSLTVTQAQFDAGRIANTVQVTAQTLAGASVPASATLTLPGPARLPAIQLDKVATSGINFTAPGQAITYDYIITNTGNVTLTAQPSVTDDRVQPVNCPPMPPAGLAPGQSITCTGTDVATQGDVDANYVTNNATAMVTQPLPGLPPANLSSPDSETVTASQSPAMSLAKAVKSGTPASYQAVGDVMSYTYTITNTGNTTIRGPAQISDDHITPAFNCGAPVMLPGASTTCTATYRITQADIDAGTVTNTAFGFIGPISSPTLSTQTDQATVTSIQDPGVSIAKSTTQTQASDFVQGNSITYHYVVTNTGNVTLPGPIAVSDDRIPAVVCPPGSLAPGATMNCQGSYVITAHDIALGSTTNNAVVSTLFGGSPVPTNTATFTIPLTAQPALTLVKTETTGAPITAVGQILTYQYVVTNTGNASYAADINIHDNKIPAPVLCFDSQGQTLSLSAGQGATCSASYTVTQADLDQNAVTNTAFAQTIFAPQSPNPAVVRSPAVTVTVPGSPTPGLTVAKTVVTGSAPVQAGDVITYQITTTNSGNQTISLLNVSDSRVGTLVCTLNGNPAAGNVTLAPGKALICTGNYTVTQADVDAQQLTNIATATGVDPGGTPITQTGNHSQPVAVPSAQLSVVKTLLNPAPPAQAFAQPGDFMTFGIAVTNRGNVTINHIQVTDNRGIGTCTIATLTPGATDASCRFVTQASQADVDAGQMTNIATATGQPAVTGATPVTGQGSVTVTGPAAAPALTLAKSSATTRLTQAGQIVTYDYVVTNVGNVTITTVPQVTDNRIGTFNCGTAPILPNRTTSCQATYAVTQADINAGSVVNTATVTAPGAPVSPPASLTITTTYNPELTLAKSVVSNTELFPYIWQTVYQIDVANTGNVTLDPLDVQDDLARFLAPATLLTSQYPIGVQVTGFVTASANPFYDGNTDVQLLAPGALMNPGEQGRILVTVTYSVAAGLPTSPNTARVVAPQLPAPVLASVANPLTDHDGDGIPDTDEGCQAGSDRDGDGICDGQDYDPTGYFYCEDNGQILPGGMITVNGPLGSQSGVGSANGITIRQDGSGGLYTFFVSQPGRYTIVPTYPRGGTPSQARAPSAAPLSLSGFTTNPAVLGSTEFGSTGFLADHSIAANTPSHLVIDITAGDPHIIGNNFAMTGCAGDAPITATKVASAGSARRGDSVGFTLTFTNGTSLAANNETFVDLLPAGLVYTPGTGTVNGSPVEPAILGRRLSWGTYGIAPGATTTVTLSARVTGTANFGTLTNKGWLEDAAGTITSNIAAAKVRIEPEHVFDCSDVIGKVFDDRNLNGYPDEGELGIPHTRVVTVRGIRITADDHGRFHVPCAELPSDIGSNFTLKLDPRSLPTGYRITTENPRTLRLTAGKMARINFGAALADVVDVDLTAAAFGDGATPVAALAGAVDALVAHLNQEPSVVRLTYLATSEPKDLVRARMDAVERLLRAAWKQKGTYKLNIERTTRRGQ